MLGVLEPSSGVIRVDGRGIQSALGAWQRQIGYVPQTVYLIDDTIRRNIALGLEDAEIDEVRVMKRAQAFRWRAPASGHCAGLVPAAGGLSLRDEATAALDNVTEQALTATLGALRGRLTSVYIAHRLSTVQACDRLVLLSKARIAAVGTYAEMRKNPDFAALSLVGETEPARPF